MYFMPKKAKKAVKKKEKLDSKKNKETKKTFKQSREILDKERLKRLLEAGESELEEELKEQASVNRSLQSGGFQVQFAESDFSPVLEKVAGEQSTGFTPVFRTASNTNASQENRGVDYSFSSRQYTEAGASENQVDYEFDMENSMNVSNMQTSTLLSGAGFDSSRSVSLENTRLNEMRKGEERTYEEPMDVDRVGSGGERRLPFEQEERKYRSVKF